MDEGELSAQLTRRGVRFDPAWPRDVLCGLLEAWEQGNRQVSRGCPTPPASETTTSPSTRRSIEDRTLSSALPLIHRMRNTEGRVGLDIGGTLAKLVMLLPAAAALEHDVLRKMVENTGFTFHEELEVRTRLPSSGDPVVIRFFSGRSKKVADLVEMIKHTGIFKTQEVHSIPVAGGGAFKFKDLFRESLNLEFVPVPEMTSVVEGLRFLVTNSSGVNPIFENEVLQLDAAGTALVPTKALELRALCSNKTYVLANVGTGVSILRVTGDGRDGAFQRVGGTACGGGTFLGLSQLLCGVASYEEALELAARGDASRVDTLVRDIYGEEGSTHLGLPANLTAANFGRCGRTGVDKPEACDVARALLQLVTQQVGLLAAAHAKLHNCQTVFFSGGFLEGNDVSRLLLAQLMRDRLDAEALFLKHSDFLGAVGSLAQSATASELFAE